jgi:hypothetical protein
MVAGNCAMVQVLKRRWGKRRGRDSNPRYPCGYNGFRDRPVQPLWHLSGEGKNKENRDTNISRLTDFCKWLLLRTNRSAHTTPVAAIGTAIGHCPIHFTIKNANGIANERAALYCFLLFTCDVTGCIQPLNRLFHTCVFMVKKK